VISFLKALLLIVAPPVAVAMQTGFGGTFWVNILLTLCGYIPGLLHGIWVFLTNEPDVSDPVIEDHN